MEWVLMDKTLLSQPAQQLGLTYSIFEMGGQHMVADDSCPDQAWYHLTESWKNKVQMFCGREAQRCEFLRAQWNE
jgi:hypothetical protein